MNKVLNHSQKIHTFLSGCQEFWSLNPLFLHCSLDFPKVSGGNAQVFPAQVMHVPISELWPQLSPQSGEMPILCIALTSRETGTSNCLPASLPLFYAPRDKGPQPIYLLIKETCHNLPLFPSSKVQVSANLQNYSNQPIISFHRNQGDPNLLMLQSLPPTSLAYLLCSQM